MTLILSQAINDGFCQVADRINSAGNTIVRRNANKTLIVIANGGLISIGLTGNALFSGEEIDNILADQIAGTSLSRSMIALRDASKPPFARTIYQVQGRILAFLKSIQSAQTFLPKEKQFFQQICCVGLREYRGKIVPHLFVAELRRGKISVLASKPLHFLVSSSFIWHISGGYGKAHPDLATELLANLYLWSADNSDRGQGEILLDSLKSFSELYPNHIGSSAMCVHASIRKQEILVSFVDDEERKETGELADTIGAHTPHYSPWILIPSSANPPRKWLGTSYEIIVGGWTIKFPDAERGKGSLPLNYSVRS